MLKFKLTNSKYIAIPISVPVSIQLVKNPRLNLSYFCWFKVLQSIIGKNCHAGVQFGMVLNLENYSPILYNYNCVFCPVGGVSKTTSFFINILTVLKQRFAHLSAKVKQSKVFSASLYLSLAACSDNC